MDQILLSISMLASNRKDTVRRCLDSLKPIMEQIPSELILVDTSTDPDVPPILAEYTDKIIKFQWCNDFSKARNVGLQAAKGEWFIYIDDDEWFVEIDELIHFFESGEYKKYGCANYIQRNFHDEELIHYSDCWVSRVIKREADTHFKSKIHEYLVPIRGKCKMLKLVANHTGYIAVKPEERLKRYNRNSVLLKEMIDEEPTRLRWRIQLAQEYWCVDKWEELLVFCLVNLEYTKNCTDDDDCRDIGTFYAGAIESLVNLERYKEAKEIGERTLKDPRTSELCHAYIRLRLAVIALREEDWKTAEEEATRYIKIGEELTKDEVRYANQKGALIVDGAFEDVADKKAYSILIACDLKKKSTYLLNRFFPKLEWNQKVIYVFLDIIPVLAEAVALLPCERVFIEAVEFLWSNVETRQLLMLEIVKWEEKSKEGYYNLLYALSKTKGEHWYQWYSKILIFEESEGSDALKEYFKGYLSNIDDIFEIPHQFIQMAEQNGVELEEIYQGIPFEKWDDCILNFTAKSSLDNAKKLERYLSGIYKNQNFYFEYAFLRIKEVFVLYSAIEKDFGKKESALREFAKQTLRFLGIYYTDNVILEYPELLPAVGQAGLLITEAFMMEETPEKMLKKLAEVSEVYETFKDAVKSYIKAYGMEIEQREQARKEEMYQLELKVREEVKKCIVRKEYENAFLILSQLKKMKPNDLELIQLTIQTRLTMLEER